MTNEEIIKMLDLIIKWSNDLTAAARTMRSLIGDKHGTALPVSCARGATAAALSLCGKTIDTRIHHIRLTIGLAMVAIRAKEEERERQQ